MDKFDRRPNARQKRRKLMLAAAAFLLLTGSFAVMFGFGNKGAIWVLWFFVFFVGGAAVMGFGEGWSRGQLWEAGLKRQPLQTPGYSPLEQAALDALLDGAVWELAGAEVSARYNSGNGCVVTLTRAWTDLPSHADRVVSFQIEGVDAPVGTCLWPATDSEPAMIDFFTRGATSRLDWLTAPFAALPETTGLVRPVMRPVVTEPSWKRFRYEG